MRWSLLLLVVCMVGCDKSKLPTPVPVDPIRCLYVYRDEQHVIYRYRDVKTHEEFLVVYADNHRQSVIPVRTSLEEYP